MKTTKRTPRGLCEFFVCGKVLESADNIADCIKVSITIEIYQIKCSEYVSCRFGSEKDNFRKIIYF